jgi:hypothetical protein
MPNPEDIANQQELLAAYRRTLAQFLKQQALISELFTPPAIANGIDESRENIRRIKTTLREWGVPVDDLPYDEAPYILAMSLRRSSVHPRLHSGRSPIHGAPMGQINQTYSLARPYPTIGTARVTNKGPFDRPPTASSGL